MLAKCALSLVASVDSSRISEIARDIVLLELPMSAAGFGRIELYCGVASSIEEPQLSKASQAIGRGRLVGASWGARAPLDIHSRRPGLHVSVTGALQ